MRLLALLLFFFISLEILLLAILNSAKNATIASSYELTVRPAFLDVLDSSGIKRETFLTGAAWADYDNDGYLDLLIAGNKTRLYRNKGDGTFMETAEKAGILSEPTMSGVFGDYDNDGCKDIYLVGHGLRQDHLYHNNCNGTFVDVSDTAKIKKELYSGFGAAWADFDNDGYLDLYVTSYGIPKKSDTNELLFYTHEPNVLYKNNGDGTFTDVTDKAGVSGMTTCYAFDRKLFKGTHPKGWPYKESFQPIWFDYNNDGKIDLFIATDAGISPLYRNDGNGTFTEVTKEAGLCRSGCWMGVTIGDYDTDGNMDIYITNVGANYLWHNNGNGTFSDVGAELGVADPRTLGWGTGFFDYDNDGNLDLYAVNGTVSIQTRIEDPEIGKVMLDKLYKNNGDGTFHDVAASEGIIGDYSKSAAAFGDYDNDGFTDIAVLTSYIIPDFRSHLYKNQGNKNHWITIQLIGTKSNRDAIGARVTLIVRGKKQIREVTAGSSFISQNSLWQTFGLGEAKIVDEIEIRWPSGIKRVLRHIKADYKLVVTE